MRIVTVGYAGGPQSVRLGYTVRDAGGEALGNALLSSPDATMARINPAWMVYARDFLQVKYEWLTTLWASTTVAGVQSRLMGPHRAWLPESGGYESAWTHQLGRDADGRPTTGIAARELAGAAQAARLDTPWSD